MNKKPLTKILFVDDDVDILTIVGYCLERLPGISMKSLTSGEEAIQEALEFQPDLILLDVIMPDMDGIETLKAMRLLPSLAHIPVVFITVRVLSEDLDTYQKLGALDVIPKPFDPLKLTANIQNIWNKYQEQSSHGHERRL